VVAEAMKSLGFVNRFGYGVQRAQALLAQNGKSPAKRAALLTHKTATPAAENPKRGRRSARVVFDLLRG